MVFLITIFGIIFLTRVFPSPQEGGLKIDLKPGGKDIFKVGRFTFAKDPSLPSSIKAYSIKNDVFDLEKAKVIAQNLGFAKNPVFKTQASEAYFEWNEENHLSFYPASRQLSFSFKEKPLAEALTNGTKPTADSAKDAAQKILENLGLWNKNLKVTKTINQKGAGSENPTRAVPEKDTNIIVLYFGLFIDDLPVLLPNPDEPFVAVRVGHDNKIIGFDYHNPPQVEKFIGEYKVIGKNQIIDSLAGGQGLVSAVTFEKMGEKVSTSEISSMKITSASLAYLLSPNVNNLFVPSIILKGSGAIKNSPEAQVTVYLPAVLQKTSN